MIYVRAMHKEIQMCHHGPIVGPPAIWSRPLKGHAYKLGQAHLHQQSDQPYNKDGCVQSLLCEETRDSEHLINGPAYSKIEWRKALRKIWKLDSL